MGAAMILTQHTPRLRGQKNKAELRQKFLRETESYLAAELRLRETHWPARTRRLRSRQFDGR
jgi:hypothetical protein